MNRKAQEPRRVNHNGRAERKRKYGRKLGKGGIFVKLEKLLSIKYRENLCAASESCYHWAGYLCCKLCFAPISMDTDGRFGIKTNIWQLALYYSLLGLQCMLIAHNFVATVKHGAKWGLDVVMVFCISSLLVLATGFCSSLFLFCKKKEIVQLLNTSGTILEHMPKRNNGKKFRVMEDLKTALVALAVTVLTATIGSAASILGFLVESMPVSLFHIFSMMGVLSLLPGLPPVVWKLILWPLEWLMYCQLMMLAAWSGMLIFVVLGIASSFTDTLRKIAVSTVESWLELHRGYHLVRLFIKLANSCSRFFFAPTITVLCACIVISLFVTIRHTELPLIPYLCFPYIGIKMFLLMFWCMFEIMNLVRETEAIKGMLVTSAMRGYGRFPPDERMYLMRAAKATRPVQLHIGDFMDVNLNVPIGMWDEILNQLLFLLAL